MRLEDIKPTQSLQGVIPGGSLVTVVAVQPMGVDGPKPKVFHGSADLPATMAKMRMIQLAEEIISQLSRDPKATVRITVEISAEYPDGAGDDVRRAVAENSKRLGLRNAIWE